MSRNVPEGKLARTGVAGFAIARVGMGEFAHKVKRPFLSKQKIINDKELLDDKNAKILFNALSQLRGTALKLAQMLGMEQGFLPESYTKELEKSFHQVPPLNRVLVRKVFMSEFNQSPELIFSQFKSEAFAAASLGQVHKAIISENEKETKVAVKVQYPGINVSIKSDLTIIRGVSRGLPNTHLILQSLDEVEARLMEEVDYRIEAKNTQWFQQQNLPKGISIPTVFNQQSTKRILTTEFINGLHLDDWLATNPSQQQRNKAATLLYEFFIHSSRKLQCMHSDPNPGNYLFHEDATITVIDFGCVKHLSDAFSDAFPRLLVAYMEDNPDDLFSAYEAIGMKFDEDIRDELYQDILLPFGQWITLPFKTESFDFAKHGDYTQQGKEAMNNLHDLKRLKKLMNIDQVAVEFIFHNRTIYGLLQIFERMGATVRLRHHWVKET